MDELPVIQNNGEVEGKSNLDGGEKPELPVIQSRSSAVGEGEGDSQRGQQSPRDPLPQPVIARLLPFEGAEEDWALEYYPGQAHEEGEGTCSTLSTGVGDEDQEGETNEDQVPGEESDTEDDEEEGSGSKHQAGGDDDDKEVQKTQQQVKAEAFDKVEGGDHPCQAHEEGKGIGSAPPTAGDDDDKEGVKTQQQVQEEVAGNMEGGDLPVRNVAEGEGTCSTLPTGEVDEDKEGENLPDQAHVADEGTIPTVQAVGGADDKEEEKTEQQDHVEGEVIISTLPTEEIDDDKEEEKIPDQAHVEVEGTIPTVQAVREDVDKDGEKKLPVHEHEDVKVESAVVQVQSTAEGEESDSALPTGGGADDNEQEKIEHPVQEEEEEATSAQHAGEGDTDQEGEKTQQQVQVDGGMVQLQASAPTNEPMPAIQSSSRVIGMEVGGANLIYPAALDPLPKSLVARILLCEDGDDDWERDLAEFESDEVEDEDGEDECQQQVEINLQPEGDVNPNQTTAEDNGKISELAAGGREHGHAGDEPQQQHDGDEPQQQHDGDEPQQQHQAQQGDGDPNQNQTTADGDNGKNEDELQSTAEDVINQAKTIEEFEDPLIEGQSSLEALGTGDGRTQVSSQSTCIPQPRMPTEGEEEELNEEISPSDVDNNEDVVHDQEELVEEMYEDPSEVNDRRHWEYERMFGAPSHLTPQQTYDRIQESNRLHEQFLLAHPYFPSNARRGQVLYRAISRNPRNVKQQNVNPKQTQDSLPPSVQSPQSEPPSNVTTTPQQLDVTPLSSGQSQVVSSEPQPHHSKNMPTSTPLSIGKSALVSSEPQPHHSKNMPSSTSSSSSQSEEQLPPNTESPSSSLEEFTETVTEDGRFIRSCFVVGDARSLTVYAYKLASVSEGMSSQARDDLLSLTFGRLSIYDDVLYSLTQASPPANTMTLSSNSNVIQLDYMGTEPSTSENFRRFFQDRMETIVVASTELFKLGSGKWLFTTPRGHPFTDHHLTGYNYVELRVKVVGDRILAFLMDGVFIVHTEPISRLLPATSSQAPAHDAFVAMSRQKIKDRTIIFSEGIHFRWPGWRIFIADGVRPQVANGRVHAYRIQSGGLEWNPAFCYLAGYSTWEINDTSVYPDLMPVLERDPQKSFEVRQMFRQAMIASPNVTDEMTASGLTISWDYLRMDPTFLPNVTLEFRDNTWTGTTTSYLNWTLESYEFGFWRSGASGRPWSYVSSSRDRTEREAITRRMITYLNRNDVDIPFPSDPIHLRSLEDAILNALNSLQQGNWRPEILLIFLPWNNIGPLLPFVKILLELYEINCVVVPPLINRRVGDAARRVARTMQIELGGIPWHIRDFPARRMLLSLVSGTTKTRTPRRVFASAGTMGVTIANNVCFAAPEGEDEPPLELRHGHAITELLTNIISSLRDDNDFELPEQILVYADESVDLRSVEQFVTNGILGIIPPSSNPELIFIQVTKTPADFWCAKTRNGSMLNVEAGVFLIEGDGFYLQSSTNKKGRQYPAYYEITNLTSTMNLRDLADLTYQATYQYYHDTEPKETPAVLVYAQDSLVYAEHGIGVGITNPRLSLRHWNRS